MNASAAARFAGGRGRELEIQARATTYKARNLAVRRKEREQVHT